MKNQSLLLDKNLKKSFRDSSDNAAKYQNRLWYAFLCKYPIRFNRHQSIGEYIVDFYCAKAKLVIELEEMQLYAEKAIAYDPIRTQYLESFGLKVLRFPKFALKTYFKEVCAIIDSQIKLLLQ